jgi:RNA polymerase sigma-70 factor, ECF subfamily
VIEAFLAATENGDIATLLELLDPEVTFRGDGGGLVPAAREIFTGAKRVARILTSIWASWRAVLRPSHVQINGAPGLLVESREWPSVISFALDNGRIAEIDVVRNAQKLSLAGTPVSIPQPPKRSDC